MQPRTLNDIFFNIVDRRQERLMLVREAGSWLPVTSQDFYRSVAGVARTLANWGVHKGDRVAILSENRPEWVVADFASFLLGAVVVPIYTTLTAQQTAYILCDSGAKVLFVSTADQLKKVLSIRDQTAVEKTMVMDSAVGHEAAQMKQLMHKGPRGREPEVERGARLITEEDLASIIYTSGTTGISKGVQLSHGNLTANVTNSLSGFDVDPVKVRKLNAGESYIRHIPAARLQALLKEKQFAQVMNIA